MEHLTIVQLMRITQGTPYGGVKTHLAPMGTAYPISLCGVRPYPTVSRWEEVDGPEVPSCKRCQKKAQGMK